MPVESCSLNGKPGYRWGKKGKCYTYTPSDEKSRKQARIRAAIQGRAIEARKHQQ